MEVTENKTKSYLHIKKWWISILSTRETCDNLTNFTLRNSLLRAFKLSKNADFDKYKYSG